MPDREKVINDLQDAVNDDWMWQHADYYAKAMENALALLKEHEAVEPYSMNAERTYGICPKCGKIVFRNGNVEENHYCGICGQAVKWE